MRALALLLVTGAAQAGAWAREPGGIYLQLGPALFVGQQRDDLVVDVESAGGRFVGGALELYAEVGLGLDLELDLQAAWVRQTHELDGAGDRSTDGPGDVELLLKWSPGAASSPVAFLAGARVAAYETMALEERVAGRPSRGPGGADLLFGFAWGRSFFPVPAWVGVDLLSRVRLGGSSAGALLRTEAGYRLGPVAFAVDLELQPAYGRSLDQPDDAPAPVPTAGAVGGKALLDLWAGLGLAGSAFWYPEALNDGPGYRVAAAVTWQR